MRFLPLARRDVVFDVAVKKHQADFVVAADGGKREQRAQFGGGLALGALARAEVLRGGDVGHQHERELAFLDVAFDERRAGAGGDVPIDRAHVVARHIGADLVELDAGTAKYRHVLAGEYVGNGAPGADLNLFDPADDLGGKHRDRRRFRAPARCRGCARSHRPRCAPRPRPHSSTIPDGAARPAPASWRHAA